MKRKERRKESKKERKEKKKKKKIFLYRFIIAVMEKRFLPRMYTSLSWQSGGEIHDTGIPRHEVRSLVLLTTTFSSSALVL